MPDIVTTDTSYFHSRMQQIGFDPKKHWAYHALTDEPHTRAAEVPVMWEDRDGNICIGIYDLNRTFYAKDTRKAKSAIHLEIYHLKRLADPEGFALKAYPNDPEKQDDPPRYLPGLGNNVTSGMGVFPYIPIPVWKKWHEKIKIPVLVITEGYLKAFVGAEQGIDIVAIPGITIWKRKGEEHIFDEIKMIIQSCQVERVIWLSDGDAFTVKWREGKDLYKRANQFFSAAYAFKELCRYLDVGLEYAWINPKQKDKGIDDLIIHNKKHVKTIEHELIKATTEDRTSAFIQKINLSKTSYNNLRDLFHITKVEKFYEHYESIIGYKKFVYRGKEYEYSTQHNKLIERMDVIFSLIIMIQNSYYMKVTKPDLRNNGFTNDLVVMKPDALKVMLGGPKKFEYAKTLIGQYNYFHGAMNEPSHVNYKEYVTSKSVDQEYQYRYYNMYKQVSHVSHAPADVTEKSKAVIDHAFIAQHCPTTFGFLQHIFGTKDREYHYKKDDADRCIRYNEVDLGLDYMTLLWLKPKVFLPILVLASEEQQTGKTTFCNYLRKIYQQNAVKADADTLTGQFTSRFASALLIVIEEASISKKAVAEKIKEMATSEDQKMERKGVDATDVASFMKIVMTTNNERDFLPISQEETRYWVRKILSASKKDFNLSTRLMEELPYFLYCIENRTLSFPTQMGRAWFPEAVIHTDALDAVKHNSRWSQEKELKDVLSLYMELVGEPIVRLSKQHVQSVALQFDLKIDAPFIAKIIENKFKIPCSTVSRKFKYHKIIEDAEAGDVTINVEHYRRKVYTFYIDQFLPMEKILCLLTAETLRKWESTIKKMPVTPPLWYSKIDKTMIRKISYSKVECKPDSLGYRLQKYYDECSTKEEMEILISRLFEMETGAEFIKEFSKFYSIKIKAMQPDNKIFD